MILNRFLVLFIAVAAALPVALADAIERLEREFARLAAASGGTMGVAAVHLETGRAAYLNPDDTFPMASTFKVPVAVRLLRMVDEKHIALSDMITVQNSDLSPGSGTISQLFDDPGLAISLHNLLELMLLISDNSATDMVLRAAGGGDAVTRTLRELEIEGIRVDRSCMMLISDYAGMKDLPARDELTREEWGKRYTSVSSDDRAAAAAAFDEDPRDTATPRGMARLLERIWKGELMSRESTERMIDIMTRCETGEERLKGMLPAGTVVAHKTGTIGGSTNDVGVISLPDGAGHLIVVAFVKQSKVEIPVRERAIAEVARAAHDFFLFHREGD